MDHKYRSTEFETSLVDLRARLLACDVSLSQHYGRGKLSQFLRTAVGLDNWSKLVEGITAQYQDLRRKFGHSIDSAIISTDLGVEKLVRDLEDRQRTTVLDWLGGDPVSELVSVLHRTRILSDDYPGAGNWLLEETAEFKTWSSMGDGSGALWIHGPVGCGKTCLTTCVIEKMLDQAVSSEVGAGNIAYFYCSRTITGGKGTDATDVLRSIVRQLAWPPKARDLDSFALDKWVKNKKSLLDKEQCEELLRHFMTTRAITIIIDALDECSDPRELLAALGKLSKEHRSGLALRIFLSSREGTAMSDYFLQDQLSSVTITPERTNQDLQNFVKGYVAIKCDEHHHALHKPENSKLRKNFETTLVATGKGSFRWTEIQLRGLLNQGSAFNPEDLKTEISSLRERPSSNDLQSAYHKEWQRNIGYVKQPTQPSEQPAESKLQRHVQRALTWMIFLKSTCAKLISLVRTFACFYSLFSKFLLSPLIFTPVLAPSPLSSNSSRGNGS
ncbi:hypothetical protein GQ53DRAFT_44838 [Thozetella sp. PMI_491]|nr:hypothetical protein GQ53DRAFT_44838 [Thozetella sp. PMI_491]